MMERFIIIFTDLVKGILQLIINPECLKVPIVRGKKVNILRLKRRMSVSLEN